MSASGTTSQRILVVDDEPMVCDSVRMMLVGDGHEVETAGSGEAALAIFEERRFDLVIVDYELPLMNGDKVAVAIKALDPNQPIVLITAYAEALQSAATPLPGVDLVISKPFDSQGFRQAVTPLLTNKVRSPGGP
jgi:CheY-like chemotaxis protein